MFIFPVAIWRPERDAALGNAVVRDGDATAKSCVKGCVKQNEGSRLGRVLYPRLGKEGAKSCQMTVTYPSAQSAPRLATSPIGILG